MLYMSFSVLLSLRFMPKKKVNQGSLDRLGALKLYFLGDILQVMMCHWQYHTYTEALS